MKPHPKWLYRSLAAAIINGNVEIVRFLLDEKVVDGDLPIESAVRGQSSEVLELFLQYGWDINRPLARNEPPALLCAIWPLLSSNYDLPDKLLAYRYVCPTEKWSIGFSIMAPTPTAVALGICHGRPLTASAMGPKRTGSICRLACRYAEV